LPPVFKEGGTVTAGNSSPMNDGAAGMILATGVGLERHGLEPMARIAASGAAGVHPDVAAIRTVPPTETAPQRAGLPVDDLDAAEGSEAFADRSVATRRRLELDPAKVNRTGGAIALGHPLGATGARRVVTAAHQLRRT